MCLIILILINKIECSEIDTNTYRNLLFDKDETSNQWGKGELFNNVAGTIR